MKKVTSLLFLLSAGSANATLIAEYDYSTATSSTSLAATYVDADYSASSLVLNNSSNTYNSFGNHFYHNGWSTSFNSSKYYELTISGNDLFSFSGVDFSLENTGGTSTYWLRSSLDGYISDISTGNFLNGLVTDYSVDLSVLGIVSDPITFRWYIAGSSISGFANHECGGVQQQGCGLSDVGGDLAFYGETVDVPEPASIALLGLGLAGLGFARKK